MKSQIQIAINEFKNIQYLDDLELLYNYQIKYGGLYKNSTKDFFKTCNICGKENTLNSHCYCKFMFNNEFGVEIVNRSEIKGFINAYNEIEKKLHQYDDNLTNEEKYVLSQGSIFDSIDIEKEDDSESIIIGDETDDEFILSDEDLVLFKNSFKDTEQNENIKATKELQFFKDIFIPIGTYLAIMQLPILIFISRFFKGFITIVSKSELMQISFFVFALGVLGLIVLKSEYQNIKIKFFKDLYSEKSQVIHFFSSLVIIAISAYEFTIFLIIVGLIIWSVTNFKKLRSAFEKSQLKKSLSIIWKKIIDVLGY